MHAPRWKVQPPYTGCNDGPPSYGAIEEAFVGELPVESHGIGKGSTFTIILPVLAVRVAPAELTQLQATPEMPRLEGIRILIVDDDDEAGKLVALVLNHLGAETREVTSVAAAVKELRLFEADIVVSDIAMPGEDGYALMSKLREIEPQLGRQIGVERGTVGVYGGSRHDALRGGTSGRHSPAILFR